MVDFANSQTEFKFVLPKGLIDDSGTLHRAGTIRLATAKDEMVTAKDPRVRENPAYGTLVRLSRTITRLGTLSAIDPEDLENLFSIDLIYLCELFDRINQKGDPHITTQCPHCQQALRVDLANLGESRATP
ncbi:phage tail assembly protein [Baaleninema sp.]|uniref:phage tail assembly protein n=1 Tax=Baaleninema sp. TaxID=3101197 RepID=UPI003D090A59